MASVMTITEILNIWNEMGVFSYVLPFLIIFAIIFAILRKSKILAAVVKEGDKETRLGGSVMEAIIAVAVALISLQFDMVSEFFAVIFPRFGIGLSIFLVLIIMLGFFGFELFEDKDKKKRYPHSWIGWVVGIGVVIWAFSSWDQWSSYSGFGGWFSEYIWAIIVLAALIALIFIFGKNKETK